MTLFALSGIVHLKLVNQIVYLFVVLLCGVCPMHSAMKMLQVVVFFYPIVAYLTRSLLCFHRLQNLIWPIMVLCTQILHVARIFFLDLRLVNVLQFRLCHKRGESIWHLLAECWYVESFRAIFLRLKFVVLGVIFTPEM